MSKLISLNLETPVAGSIDNHIPYSGASNAQLTYGSLESIDLNLKSTNPIDDIQSYHKVLNESEKKEFEALINSCSGKLKKSKNDFLIFSEELLNKMRQNVKEINKDIIDKIESLTGIDITSIRSYKVSILFICVASLIAFKKEWYTLKKDNEDSNIRMPLSENIPPPNVIEYLPVSASTETMKTEYLIKSNFTS